MFTIVSLHPQNSHGLIGTPTCNPLPATPSHMSGVVVGVQPKPS